MRRFKELPTVVAIAAITIGAVQLVDGARSTGVTIDEPTHTLRTQAWIDHGWYVPESSLVDGEPNPADAGASPFVYGPAFSSLSHIANVEAGNEEIGQVSEGRGAANVRHLLVAALAALTIGVVGVLAWLLTGSWRGGIWTAAALIAIPAWLGQGFFNIKDVPVACGYTLVTSGLVLALAAAGTSWGRGRRLLIGVLIAGGVFIAVGTRLAMWAPILASAVGYAGLRIGQMRWGNIGRTWRLDLPVVAGGIAGVAAIAAVYPKIFETPRTLLTHSISDSASYAHTGLTLTAGQLLPQHPPVWYLPVWLGACLPLMIGGLAVLGAVLTIRSLVRSRRRGVTAFWIDPKLGLLLVLQQALLLPLISIAGDAVLYDGARQHLYVFPTIAVFAGLGAYGLRRWTSERPGRLRQPLVAVGLGLALAFPLAEQTRLFPYNYAYVNPVAGLGGVNGRWETDFWFASAPEALERVPDDATLRCSYQLTRHPGDPPDFRPCSREKGGAAPVDGLGSPGSPQPQEVWVVAWSRGREEPPPYCREVDDVTRGLRGESVRMARILRCDTPGVVRSLREDETR